MADFAKKQVSKFGSGASVNQPPRIISELSDVLDQNQRDEMNRMKDSLSDMVLEALDNLDNNVMTQEQCLKHLQAIPVIAENFTVLLGAVFQDAAPFTRDELEKRFDASKQLLEDNSYAFPPEVMGDMRNIFDKLCNHIEATISDAAMRSPAGCYLH